MKVHIDRDVAGYRPEKEQLDRAGHEVEDRIYPESINGERLDRRGDASDGACKLRIMRCGSWLSLPRTSRSPDGVMNPVGYQNINIGFRAARGSRALLRERQSSEPEA